jgi:hypothetical protein
VGAILSALGLGGVVLGILVWEEGGEAVGALLAVGIVGLGSLAWWLVRRKREGKPALIDADLFRSKYFRLGISWQTMQQIAPGGLMIALPICLQMVFEYRLPAQQLHPLPDRGTARERGGRRELRRRLVRARVRPRVRRRDHARLALAHLHQHGQSQRRALTRGAAAGREGRREERRGDDQRPRPGTCSPESC